MRVVPRQDRDPARAEGHRRLALDLDQRVAGADKMIADQRLGLWEERREMVGRELCQQAEIAGQLRIDHHAAGQAQRPEDVVKNVH
jgi:hypothetical protein